MSRTRVSLLVSFLTAVTVSPRAPADEGPFSTPPAWTVPDTQWRVRVWRYRPLAAASSDPRINAEMRKRKVQHEFDMTITVLLPANMWGWDIARFRFTLSSDAPFYIQGKEYLAQVRLENGKIYRHPKLIGERGAAAELSEIGQLGVLFTHISGFPIDWIIEAADIWEVPATEQDLSMPLPDDPHHRHLHKVVQPASLGDGAPDAVRIEASIRNERGEVIAPHKRVVQTWVPGEPWWRSFQRYQGDRLELVAIRLDDETGEPMADVQVLEAAEPRAPGE